MAPHALTKTKILFMINHLDLGGVERAVVDIVNGLDKDKYDVTLQAVFNFKPEMYDINKAVQVKKVFGFYFKGFTKLIQKLPGKWLYNRIVKEQYDFEVAFQAGAPTYILANSTNHKAVKYCWVHGLDMTNPAANERYHKIIFVGEAVKNHYAHLFPDKDKLLVKYNPMDIQKVKALAKEPVEIKADGGETVFCSVGRLSQEKGYSRLIAVFKRLKDAGKPVKLYIVGDGALKQALLQQIAESGLQDTVFLVGYQKNPYKYIHAADAYICSSFYEGLNISATEAMILHKPVITTDVFGMQELIGESGFGMITENDAEALYSGIVKCLEEGQLACMQEQARARAAAFFKENPMDEIEKLFAYMPRN